MTTASIDQLAARPQAILEARQTVAKTSRRLYHRQLEFLAAVYNTTSDIIEQQFDALSRRA